MMKRLSIVVLSLLAVACAHVSRQDTIAQLERMHIELKDADIEDGLEKAMESYRRFLEETPTSGMAPDAIRRLADLKLESEFGAVVSGEQAEVTTRAVSAIVTADGVEAGTDYGGVVGGESEKDFENRASHLPENGGDAQAQPSGAEEAIALYNRLLDEYPEYGGKEQVLYQLARAYDEVGEVDKSMQVMTRLVTEYPQSHYMDELQFRRGEYFFVRKKFLDAEEAYGEVLTLSAKSLFYERALYKKGWSLYKQGMYEEALGQFLAMLDYKVSIGYDFDQTENDIEAQRVSDTFHVVSLSLSNMGGSESTKEYFLKYGSRVYEHRVYKELAEFYFAKRRYSDAAASFNTFIEANPFHENSPHYSMRVIEIYMKGGFPRLVIKAKRQFASTYGLDAEYWNHFDQGKYPQVLGYLKTNIVDLANHYHSLYQNKELVKDKPTNFAEAVYWYREFLKSFPQDDQSAGINYQLADLFLENKDFEKAAIEYEHSAYDYPVNEKSPKAAYAAVYAYREHLKTAPDSQIGNVKREIIRTSLRLVDTFPDYEKAVTVLGAAADDLYMMHDYPLAIKVGHRLVNEYPDADVKIRRGAWLVVAHSSYESALFADAELAYTEVLNLMEPGNQDRAKLVENLAASVYKQGEQAKEKEQYREAVRHFLRIADVTPASEIRPAAEYDAAAVLIQIMDLEQAVTVLLTFRENYPEHKLQKDVTKKIAYVYKEMGRFVLAANEYERVAAESEDKELIRAAILQAAELYEKADDSDNALRIYQRFVKEFPKPLEFVLETYFKIAMIYKGRNDIDHYHDTLAYIIKADAKAGDERTDRTRYLAAQSSLVLVEPDFNEFLALKLVKPFKDSLGKKQKGMKALVKKFSELLNYKVADVTAASTYHLAEIYYNFNRSLLEAEKPDNLSDVELEEFNLMVEDQAYPFEEKSIKVHEKNVELLGIGVHSQWIDKSIEKLAVLMPARYDKPEESVGAVVQLNGFVYLSPRYVRDQAQQSESAQESVAAAVTAEEGTASAEGSPPGTDDQADTGKESAESGAVGSAVTIPGSGEGVVNVVGKAGSMAPDARVGSGSDVSTEPEAGIPTDEAASKETVTAAGVAEAKVSDSQGGDTPGVESEGQEAPAADGAAAGESANAPVTTGESAPVLEDAGTGGSETPVTEEPVTPDEVQPTPAESAGGGSGVKTEGQETPAPDGTAVGESGEAEAKVSDSQGGDTPGVESEGQEAPAADGAAAGESANTPVTTDESVPVLEDAGTGGSETPVTEEPVMPDEVQPTPAESASEDESANELSLSDPPVPDSTQDDGSYDSGKKSSEETGQESPEMADNINDN